MEYPLVLCLWGRGCRGLSPTLEGSQSLHGTLEVKSQGQAEVAHRNREAGASYVSTRPHHSR